MTGTANRYRSPLEQDDAKHREPEAPAEGILHATHASQAMDDGHCESVLITLAQDDAKQREPEAPAEGISPRHPCIPGDR